ncbi:hypothetical protein B0H94_1046 [Salsuginibacillus halophilus]|uniref:Uncharacterized protein n=2 Tax=Salsuginibacillus halophilus TaxID=517424 RepID=A0A2P8HQC1_9BACI|nr:hypothetical protein B0H94_1046 [Salsuginibacillus halophilus]
MHAGVTEELEEIAMKDEKLQQAFRSWTQLSQTPDEWLAYESRLKQVLDEEAAKRETELAIEESYERGQHKQDVYVTARLLNDKFPEGFPTVAGAQEYLQGVTSSETLDELRKIVVRVNTWAEAKQTLESKSL